MRTRLTPRVSQTPMSTRPQHVLVIGAGITGVTTAYSLIRKGYRVTVVDRHPYPAMETSYANGGQLSASNAEVWNSWSTLWKGIQWMLRADAPLLFSPRFSLHKYSWLAEFWAAIRHYRANTIATARLAIAARQYLFGVAERENLQFDLQKRGILHLYYGPKSFYAAQKANHLLRHGGLDRHPVTPTDIKAIEPTLHGDFYGGFFTPSDATGDIHKFTRGLAEACIRHGARFQLETLVTDIRFVPAAHQPPAPQVHLANSDTGLALEPIVPDALVICAGVHSRHLAAQLGDRINIYPVKGYSITVGLHDETSQQAAPTVSLLDEAAKIVTSRLGPDRFRVAGTAEFNGYNRDIRADRIAPLVKWCRRLFPDMSTSQVVPWAGLRHMTPNMMPRVGKGRRPRIYYNTGHGHLGWTLSAATAAAVTETLHATLTA
jgi:D-amino-acid dehydrogenase